MNALENAKQLKAELDSFRPLTGEIEARIMQKFRLDWNFHSNNIEGNSLTYGETKALILFGITAQGKPLKDHFEITGHNEAINWVVDLVKGETELTEVFIRQLHELLLKESHYKEAVTSEGKQTRRKIEVGKYKTQPNHVITNTGEPFFFATPEETPIKMGELVDWFRKERDKTGVNPIILASLFHYKFIRIHPFDDGNGRTARILMNFILMQFGFPPVIIRTEDKENYYRVLRLADADELEPFIEYIAENLVRSLEIMIKGAKGESIEEADDLDKELALLEKRAKQIGQKLHSIKSLKNINKILDESILPLILRFQNQNEKFAKFYVESCFSVQVHQWKINKDSINSSLILDLDSKALVVPRMSIIEETINSVLAFQSHYMELSDQLVGKLKNINQEEEVYLANNLDEVISVIKAKTRGLIVKYKFETFNRLGVKDFNYVSMLYIEFKKTKFVIYNSFENFVIEKQYSDILSIEEINEIVKPNLENHKKVVEEVISTYEKNVSKLLKSKN